MAGLTHVDVQSPPEAPNPTPAATLPDERRLTVAISLGVAIVIGVLFGLASLKIAVGLVVVSAGLVVFGRLAMVRFEGLVIGILVIRSALDSLSLHGHGGEEAAAPGSSPAAVLAVGFMVVAGVWLLAQRKSSLPRPTMPSYVRLPAVALLLAGFASILSSDARGASLAEAIRIGAAVTMLVILERLMTNLIAVRKILIAVFASALVPLLYATYQVASGGTRRIGGFNRIQGTFNHPNPFAIYLCFMVIMGAALFRYASPKQRAPMAVLLAACWMFLLLTYTRSAWIAALIGVLVVGALQSRKLAIGLLGIVIVAALAIPSISSRFSDVGQSQYSGQPGNSLSWRFDYWDELIPLANHTPVTGIGLKGIERQTTAAKNAHDDFLRSYVEMGLLGLLAYLFLLVGLARTAARALKVTTSGLPRGIAVGFAGVLSAFVVLSAVSNIISQNVLLWYFFAFASAATAMIYHSQRLSDQELEELTRPDPVITMP